MSSNEDDDNENENDRTLIIKRLNDNLDEIINKSKPFEDQIKSIRKVENLGEYWHSDDFGDKELKFKQFKLKLAHLANIIDKKLFEQIFGHKFETADKLINTANKEENQIIVKNNNKNKKKLYEEDDSYNYVIQPSE